MTTQEQKCRRLEALHRGPEAFIIPNPWDAGSARLLESLGFQALATTSAGFAFTLARADGQPTLDEKLVHCRDLAAVTSVPINVDFEDGFAEDPEQVAGNIRRLAETGVAGCSIEDFSRTSQRLFDTGQAVERVAAAVQAVGELGMPFQLTARAEQLLRGEYELAPVIERLQAFQAAGAHVLYPPGLRSLDDLRQVTAEVDGPVNVLSPFMPQVTLSEFAAAGARRVSLGSALAWAALAPVLDAAREMTEHGSFGWLAQAMAGAAAGNLIKR